MEIAQSEPSQTAALHEPLQEVTKHVAAHVDVDDGQFLEVVRLLLLENDHEVVETVEPKTASVVVEALEMLLLLESA